LHDGVVDGVVVKMADVPLRDAACSLEGPVTNRGIGELDLEDARVALSTGDGNGCDECYGCGKAGILVRGSLKYGDLSDGAMRYSLEVMSSVALMDV